MATSRLLAGGSVRKIPRRVVERVHEVSGGNPLYVLALGAELHRAATATSRTGASCRSRGTLVDAIAQRLEHVRAGVEAPLFAVAALAEPTVGAARRRASTSSTPRISTTQSARA